MSKDEKGFLARWAQRKRDAGKEERKPAVSDVPPEQAKAPPATAASEAEPPFDLSSLPKLEELTANTDMTVFFKKGVPESIRNAALRKSWALDPAIRNYVNPALDYAYDWNTPGGVPGAGELAPGTDIARMVSQIMGDSESQPSQASVDGRACAETNRRDDSSNHVAEHQADALPPAPSVRLSEAPSPASEQRTDAASATESSESSTADSDHAHDEQQAQPRTFASQQEARRHGTARPK